MSDNIDLVSMLKKIPALNSLFQRVEKLENNMEDVYGKLQKSSAGLRTDGNAIKDAANKLHEVVTTEAKRILEAYDEYGTNIKNYTLAVAKSGLEVGKQMDEARTEMSKPLGAVKWHTQEMWNQRWWLPGVVINAFYAFAYTAFLGYGGQSAVLWEVVEAFIQIGDAFRNLSGNFQKLAAVQKDAPTKLANIMNDSMIRINNAVMDFTNSFTRLGNNLAANLE